MATVRDVQRGWTVICRDKVFPHLPVESTLESTYF